MTRPVTREVTHQVARQGVALLETRGLTVRYGGLTAVDALDLRVDRGGFVGLIGPNGAGKTTAIDALSGFVPSEGEIRFGGTRIDGRRAHERARLGLARTFQSVELFDELTVRENVLVPAERGTPRETLRDLFTRGRRSRDADVDSILDLLGIAELADLSPQNVSLGQRKLVTVARALAAHPALLLLDEPAAGLDSAESLALGEKLRGIAGTDTAVVLVDHDMGLVLGVCEYLYVLDFGKVIAEGPPDLVSSDAAVISAYLGADTSEPMENAR